MEYFTDLGEKVEWVTEQNYLFEFDDRIKQKIYDWINSKDDPIKPEAIKNLTLKDLDASKEKISISRPRTRISWGIEVPTDKDQTIYVWLDALTNYKTVNDSFKDFNGEMIHVIGKDINKFHSIYWPAFLLA